MEKVIDCKGEPLPVFGKGVVTYCSVENGASPKGSVWLLKVLMNDSPLPVAGQFYLLRAVKSGVLLGRPISIYMSKKAGNGVALDFLILKKGTGTQELCALKQNDQIELIGPLGNSFPQPKADDKICIVGGGIGIAPVAGFASTLSEKSYDFFASFKSGSYGLEYINPAELTVTTDDGSVGIHGMLPAALNAQILKEKGYTVLYACGPTPMLAYLQKICIEAGVQSYLSMENRMACGVGACLGCTITTTEGNKRCCKDGPVFPGEILNFEPPKFKAIRKESPVSDADIDLSVEVAGVRFENPVIAASGTFGYGSEYSSIFDVNSLGGICSKGLTLQARPGNTGTRLVETPSGLINSIGLENPGIAHFIKHELPSMLALKPVTIANLSGSSLETYIEGARLLEKTAVPMIELNISCPNVKAGGMSFGMQAEAAASVTKAVREVTKKPLMVKLTPNAPDLIGIAMAVREAGADALSLVNTFQAMSIDLHTGRPVFDNIRAGFSGPAVKPIALRMVYDVVQAMNKLPENERIPVVGLGGISCWQDAVEFLMAGADAIQVGTATFANPNTMIEIVNGLRNFMKEKGFRTISEFKGIAQ
ncbi:dihydroorotate dehydrogenase [uncultured Treponema sp.]|uniref:dihydroorotate dehydrogenase n=1 Tax=uncultured Treponema sp. TaxID=162155 RepID=UPI0025EE1A7E|nr:dihydroorotate dehydrogenase [uncultured Treponema sp.]